MPANVGEEVCGEWLRHLRGCEFVQYNLKTAAVQGEIDVVGINLAKRIVYACEVAVHLVTGLQYVKASRPDNVDRLTAKLKKDADYLRANFADYDHVLMFWSPVVKNQKPGSKYNQLRDVRQIVDNVRANCGLEVQVVINEGFHAALADLRAVAKRETKELTSGFMRYLQIEEHLAAHLDRLRR